MDNKKLMHILLHDVGELEQFIADIRHDGSFDALDMELLHTRISGIRHLLEVAADSNVQPQETPKVPENHKPVSVALVEEKPQIEITHFQKNEAVKKEVLSEKPVPVQINQPVVEEIPETLLVGEILGKEAMKNPSSETGSAEEQDYQAGEQMLADKFVAGKSVNDILFEKSKTEPEVSVLPLSSLSDAIGTNERFLFTRELFQGNMARFNETLDKLDHLHNIREAADFLRENFKWDKNETSLRFIDLIKRRFADRDCTKQ